MTFVTRLLLTLQLDRPAFQVTHTITQQSDCEGAEQLLYKLVIGLLHLRTLLVTIMLHLLQVFDCLTTQHAACCLQLAAGVGSAAQLSQVSLLDRRQTWCLYRGFWLAIKLRQLCMACSQYNVTILLCTEMHAVNTATARSTAQCHTSPAPICTSGRTTIDALVAPVDTQLTTLCHDHFRHATQMLMFMSTVACARVSAVRS